MATVKETKIGGVRARYDEGARKALSYASEEAQRYSHNYLGQEHILLGLLRVEEGLAARVLSTFGVNLDRVRNRLEVWIGRGDRALGAGDVPYTHRARRALQLAVEEAQRLGEEEVGTHHLLLGMLREGDGVGFRILEGLDVNLGQAYSVIVLALAPDRVPEVARNSVITVRLSERDLDALDALVEAGVRSTRSDAAAWLVSTAIDANPGLFKQVYATVTEIRRLRGETQGLVQQFAPGELALPATDPD